MTKVAGTIGVMDAKTRETEAEAIGIENLVKCHLNYA